MQVLTIAQQCNGCSSQYVCRCLRVTEEQLVSALTNNPVQTIADLRCLTGAGDGCTCCHLLLQSYIEIYARDYRATLSCVDDAPNRTALPLAEAG